MALSTYNATSNTTPDQGGTSAVTSPTNTGHASSQSASIDLLDSDALSCRWQSFPAGPGGQISSVTLKVDHTSSGGLVGAGANNAFTLEYSLNNGSSWNTAVSRTRFTASQGPTTFSVALSVGQDLTQVRVRDLISTSTVSDGETANCAATIANIKIEVVTIDAAAIVMM
jgi:hypothetical protein